MKSNINYPRFLELNEKIKSNTATQVEKNEYMEILYKNGDISKNQYDEFKKQNNTSSDLLEAGMTIGGLILVSYLLSKLFEKN